MHNVLDSPTFDLSIAGVGLRVGAPQTVVDVLHATLSNVPSMPQTANPISLSAHRFEDSWEVIGKHGNRKLLDGMSGVTQVAGALVSSAIAETAKARALRTVRATVVERDGSAMAMIGADWESTVTIATHLHTRGWRYVCSDHALYDSDSNTVLGFEKALYITSSSLEHLPVAYRGAVEASPWCVTRHGISFYAVNPAMVGTSNPWTSSAQLRAVLFVDGRADDFPALETFAPGVASSDRIATLAIDERHSIAELTVGSYVVTCDLIERWFASLDTYGA